MANLSDAHAGGHGHADDGAVHAHVSSVPFYVAVFLGLLFLTGATVGQSYMDLGKLNIVLVVIIATLKASLVVTFFMHLKWDNRFNALVFLSTLFFIGIFFAYTMNDTNNRGGLDPDQNVHVWAKTGELAPGGMAPHVASSAHGAEEGPHGGSTPAPEHGGSTPVPQH